MAFNSYEELRAAVEDRRKAILTIEVELGGSYSQEHEDAKREVAQAKAMKQVVGNAFLADNLEELEQRVADTRPESNSVWLQYRQLPVATWAMLIKTQGLSPVEQYEKVLVETFIGVFGQDPTEPGEDGEVQPLSADPALVSSKGNDGILSGGMLHSVVQSFMAWQNSGGEVSIRPTRSGRV